MGNQIKGVTLTKTDEGRKLYIVAKTYTVKKDYGIMFYRPCLSITFYIDGKKCDNNKIYNTNTFQEVGKAERIALAMAMQYGELKQKSGYKMDFYCV